MKEEWSLRLTALHLDLRRVTVTHSPRPKHSNVWRLSRNAGLKIRASFSSSTGDSPLISSRVADLLHLQSPGLWVWEELQDFLQFSQHICSIDFRRLAGLED